MSSKGISQLPVYRRAIELQTMSQALAFCVAGSKDFLSLYTSDSLRDQMTDALLTDTGLIRKQIALAASTRSHHIRRGSLQFISVMIRNLHSYCRGLERDGVRESEYLDLLQSELRSFRKSFKAWRKSLG